MILDYIKSSFEMLKGVKKIEMLLYNKQTTINIVNSK